MNTPQEITVSNARALLPLIRGSVVAVYLAGRDKPMTGLSVCGFAGPVLIARANGSTHLIPSSAIVCIRFAPDCEPGRDPKHKLYALVSQRRGRPIPGGKESPGEIHGTPRTPQVHGLPAFETKINRQERESTP